MKKFIAAIGIIAIALIVFFAIRYGVINYQRDAEINEMWRMSYLERRPR